MSCFCILILEIVMKYTAYVKLSTLRMIFVSTVDLLDHRYSTTHTNSILFNDYALNKSPQGSSSNENGRGFFMKALHFMRKGISMCVYTHITICYIRHI